jgi:predicted nucleic acid-binding protein
MHRGLLLLEAKASIAGDHRLREKLTAALLGKRRWYDAVIDRFSSRIIPIDLGIAQKWAEVSVRFPSLRDGDKAIAATAVSKRFGVATRNLGDFKRVGLRLVNPFDPSTWDDDWDDDPITILTER